MDKKKMDMSNILNKLQGHLTAPVEKMLKNFSLSSEDKYFKDLNYTLGNEDTTFEYEWCKSVGAKRLFCICGSGSRFIPLMAIHGVEHITVADLSSEQLAYARLKLKTIHHLSYEDFLLFWGFPPYETDKQQEKRKQLFYQLPWQENVLARWRDVFSQVEWQSLLYLGRWEQTFQKLSWVTRQILGPDFDHMFKFSSIHEQQKYYKLDFNKQRWEMVLFLLGNAKVFNMLLYRGSFVKKNVEETYLTYYARAYEHLFQQTLASENFFLQMSFFGKIIFSAGLPLDAREDIFNAVKNVRKTQLSLDFRQDNFLHFLAEVKEHQRYDFLSLSDIPSYFDGETERTFLQKIRPSLLPGALIIYRSYLRVPNCDIHGFVDVTDEHPDWVRSEKMQMYKLRVLKALM